MRKSHFWYIARFNDHIKEELICLAVSERGADLRTFLRKSLYYRTFAFSDRWTKRISRITGYLSFNIGCLALSSVQTEHYDVCSMRGEWPRYEEGIQDYQGWEQIIDAMFGTMAKDLVVGDRIELRD